MAGRLFLLCSLANMSFSVLDIRKKRALFIQMVELMIDSAYQNHMNTEEEQDNLTFDEYEKNELSFHHQVHDILQDVDWNDIPALMNRMDDGPMSEMAQFHKTIILSKRRKLVDEHLVMRASYNSLAFAEYPAEDFKRKSFEYIKRSGIYQWMGKINQTNPKASQTRLAKIVEQVEQTLKDLLCSKSITAGQYLHMRLNRSYVQLNYLHFVPDTDQVLIDHFSSRTFMCSYCRWPF